MVFQQVLHTLSHSVLSTSLRSSLLVLYRGGNRNKKAVQPPKGHTSQDVTRPHSLVGLVTSFLLQADCPITWRVKSTLSTAHRVLYFSPPSNALATLYPPDHPLQVLVPLPGKSLPIPTPPHSATDPHLTLGKLLTSEGLPFLSSKWGYNVHLSGSRGRDYKWWLLPQFTGS